MEEEPPVLKGKPLFVILSIVFLDLVGVGILIPIVPILLAGPRSPYYVLPAGYTIQQGYILLGWLVAIYSIFPVSYTHLRAHETPEHLVCRLLLEKKKKKL